MLHVGYPVTFETAKSLFPWAENMDGDEFEMILPTHNIGLWSVDKGLYILGLEIPELSNLWDNFVQVEDALILILQAKKTLVTALKESHADLSEFNIEPMEGEPKRVYNPEPYLISCNT